VFTACSYCDTGTDACQEKPDRREKRDRGEGTSKRLSVFLKHEKLSQQDRAEDNDAADHLYQVQLFIKK
jgi:hypothetical protein